MDKKTTKTLNDLKLELEKAAESKNTKVSFAATGAMIKFWEAKLLLMDCGHSLAWIREEERRAADEEETRDAGPDQDL